MSWISRYFKLRAYDVQTILELQPSPICPYLLATEFSLKNRLFGFVQVGYLLGDFIEDMKFIFPVTLVYGEIAFLHSLFKFLNLFKVHKWNWLNAMSITKVNHLVIENNAAKLKSNFHKTFTHSTHFEKSFAERNNSNIHVGLYYSRYTWSLDTYEKYSWKILSIYRHSRPSIF